MASNLYRHMGPVIDSGSNRLARPALRSNPSLPCFAEAIAQSVATIKARWPIKPHVGVILGSGLGELAHHFDIDVRISCKELPHFPQSTADGHLGQLLCGALNGTPVVAMQGRCHLYEGYSVDQVTLPVRVMHALGIEVLVLSCASGGINPRYALGDILIIDDHLNLCGARSLPRRGARPIRLPGRRLYCPHLVEAAMRVARSAGFAAHRGVYAGLTGPNYETRAEYRFLRSMGVDAVGMSTVCEAIAAAECGLKVLALSTVTNVCRPDKLTKTAHESVLAAAAAAEPKVRRIVFGLFSGDPLT